MVIGLPDKDPYSQGATINPVLVTHLALAYAYGLHAGGDADVAARLGFESAPSVEDALAMFGAEIGRAPSVVHLRIPPLLIARVGAA
jgi:hypothetical protein